MEGGLRIDLSKLVSGVDEDPRPLEIIKRQRQEQPLPEPDAMSGDDEHKEDLSKLSDQELKDSLRRLRSQREQLVSKLPDNGKKLLARIKLLGEEKKRRELPRSEVDIDSPKESSKSNSVTAGFFDGFEQEDESSPAVSEPKFGACFSRKMEENTGCWIINPFDKKPNDCEPQKTRDLMEILQVERQKGQSSSRQKNLHHSHKLSRNGCQHNSWKRDQRDRVSSVCSLHNTVYDQPISVADKRSAGAAASKEDTEKEKVTISEELSSDSDGGEREQPSSSGEPSRKAGTPVPMREQEGPLGSIDMNRIAPEEVESDVGDAVKKSPPREDEVRMDQEIAGAAAMASKPGEAARTEQSPAVSTNSSEVEEFAVNLLQSLNERDGDREVSLARFGLMPSSDVCQVDKFRVHPMLVTWAQHLLHAFPNLTTNSTAKRRVAEDAFSNLCATLRHMEVTPFAEMNEDFFRLCRDAIDDSASINFEVEAVRAHLLDIAKAFLGKGEFGKAGDDPAFDVDERIKEQAEHVAKMEKSLVETRELVVKLEQGLEAAKAQLELLHQEKELVDSWEIVQLRHACLEAAKFFGDEPGPFKP